MWKLVRLFLVEEMRLRSSFSTSLSLIILPEVVLLGAMCGYIFLPLIDDSFSYEQVHMGVLGSLFMFGISMGGIAFLGKEFIERSLGPVTMLAASIAYHPVDERRMYLSYFLHDLVFYIFLVLAPMTVGLSIGLIVRPMSFDRFLLITAAQWATFLLGLSLSMLVSSMITNRKRGLLLMVPFTILPLVIVQLITGEVRGFLPTMLAVTTGSWVWLFITFSIVLSYISIGIFTFDGFEKGMKRSAPGSYKQMLWLAKVVYPRDRTSKTLFAREMIGLFRGRAYIRIGFSLFFPLLVMSGMIGLISGLEDVPVSFNLTFFAVMVSFFTISIYTHLSNLDFIEFDQTIPVNAPALIRVKLRLYLVISLPIALLFLLTMSIATWDLEGLLFGLPLILVAVPYMGYVTAYLTGLWTNSLLFDSSVFMRYMLFTVLPLMFSTILSFLMVDMLLPSIIGISTILVIGIAAIMIISRGLDRKWKDTVLSSSGTGFRE